MSEQFDDVFDFDDKPKRKNEDNYTWQQAWQSIGIFAGSALALGVINNFLQWVILGDKLQTYNELLGGISGFNNPMLGVYDNPLMTMIFLLIGVVLYIIGLMFVYGIVHLLATKALNGIGSYRGILVQTQWWNVGTIVISSILMSLYSFYPINRLVELYGDNIDTATTAQFQEDLLLLM